MSASEQKPSTLAIAPHGALCLAGANSLAARARTDLRNREEAEEWLRKGLEFKETSHSEEAFKCFEQGIRVSPNDPELQYQIGSAFHSGTGAGKLLAKALSWYRMAAEQGHADAQFLLVGFYDRSRVQALAWLRMAAEQGYLMAQYSMCNIYGYGVNYGQSWNHDVPRDYMEACFWRELIILDWKKCEMRGEYVNEFLAKLSPDEQGIVKVRAAESFASHQPGRRE
jgi:TPR repeat protein